VEGIYWAGVAALVAMRVTWWLEFARFAAAAGSPLTQLRENLRLATFPRLRRLGVDASREHAASVHKETIARFFGLRTDAMTLGALAFAGWAALAGTNVVGVERYSLEVLFVGVLFTLSGPILFRTGGTEGTRMGLATTVSIGYGSIVISLASLLPAVFDSNAMHALGALVVLVVVVREIGEVRIELQLTRRLFADGVSQERASGT
jgi:hypothetical protein